MDSLQERRIVVMGASRGLGEAMSIGFAHQGARLVLAARNASDLEAVAASCREAASPQVSVVPTDVGNARAVQALVDRAVADLGGIDVFVANSGTSYPSLTSERFSSLDTYPPEIVETIFRVNTLGMWHCMRSALPVMESGSSFIAIGSETGRMARAGSGPYAVSKGTVDTLVAIAAGEVVDRGVRVNCLTPGGMVDTHLFGPDKMPEQLKSLPMGYSTPEVIVDAAIWLAGDESADVTGQQLSGRDFNNVGAAAVQAVGTPPAMPPGMGARPTRTATTGTV